MSHTMTHDVDEISDEELTLLAMAADPNVVVPDDAVSVWEFLGDDNDLLLPAWYMPAAAGQPRTGRRWKRIVVILIIIAFLVVDGYGLCSTFGSITIA